MTVLLWQAAQAPLLALLRLPELSKACMHTAAGCQSRTICRGDSLVPAHRVEGLAAQRKAPALNSDEVLTAIIGPSLSARRLCPHLQETGSSVAPWLPEAGPPGTQVLAHA